MNSRVVSVAPSGLNISNIAIIIATILIAAIPFIYGKYYEFNSNDPFDGSLNVYSAQSLVNGQKLGSEVIPSARPATLLVNVIGVRLFGYSEAGPKIIQTVLQVLALGLMFYTLRKVYGPLAAAAALIMAAFYLSLPPFCKFGNVKEQYMITCMLITACSVMLGHISGRYWWMMIAGAAAINIYYFKPTGASVIAAVVVYLLLGPIFRYRTFRQTGMDIALFIAGTIAGLLPLTIFYAWQGQAGDFLSSFPASIIKMLVGMVVFVAIIYFAIRERKRFAFLGVFKQIRPIFWIVGAILIFAMLIPWAIYFAKMDVLESYLYNIRPFGFVMRLWWRITSFVPGIFSKVIAEASTAGYVASSKEASVFQTQFADVFGYYRSFVVPIGISLIAVGIAVCVFVKSAIRFVKSRILRPQTASAGSEGGQEQTGENKFAECFALLFVIWWILDMIFVWVSPRSYVQYFLPFNASAAMLVAYALYHFRRRPWGYIWILAAWLLVDLLIRTLVPASGFLHFGFRSLGGYWLAFGKYMIPVAIAVAICAVCRTEKLKGFAVLACGIICVGMFFWLNTPNLKTFSNKIETVKMLRSSGQVSAWEQLGRFIKQRSDEDDGLYVWGWLPGIYVESGLSAPTLHPSEANMHTVSPKYLAKKTNGLVAELKANKPRYIVDSQKVHFPYYDHPVFDLWPRWTEGKKKTFHFRHDMRHGLGGTKLMTASDEQRERKEIMNSVEKYTLWRLTVLNRIGGAVEESKAREMAVTERLRHEAMLPLRRFVMSNYKFAGNFGTHVLFKRTEGMVNER